MGEYFSHPGYWSSHLLTIVDTIWMIGGGQIPGLVVWSVAKQFDHLTLSSQCVCLIFWHHCTLQNPNKNLTYWSHKRSLPKNIYFLLQYQEKIQLFSDEKIAKLPKAKQCQGEMPAPPFQMFRLSASSPRCSRHLVTPSLGVLRGSTWTSHKNITLAIWYIALIFCSLMPLLCTADIGGTWGSMWCAPGVSAQ